MARTYKNAYDYYARIKCQWPKIGRARLYGLIYDSFLIFLPGLLKTKQTILNRLPSRLNAPFYESKKANSYFR